MNKKNNNLKFFKKQSRTVNKGHISTLDTFLLNSKQKNIATLKLLTASEILESSFGEVQNPETLNYRNMKPVRFGLLCEEIFGPINDYECSCGKYSGILYENMQCPDCNVLVTRSVVRRERRGHITLAEPVLHPWYLSISKNPICLLLNIKYKLFIDLINERKYCVFDESYTQNYKLIIDKYSILSETYSKDILFTGVKALEKVLYAINLPTLYNFLSLQYQQNLANNEHKKNIANNIGKRMLLIDNMIKAGNKPENIILKVLPVLPAGLRNIVMLDNGLPGTTDINYLYKTIIIRNKRIDLLKYVGVNIPDIIFVNNRQLMQVCVNLLFINSLVDNPIRWKGRVMKCLTDFLKGKKGMLRMNLLGRRVNFSARSVIVVNNNLKLNECGIPKLMALELFKPFIASKLLFNGVVTNLREAFNMINEKNSYIWQLLDEVVKTRMIILNRAPSLHINSIQAFDIKLVDGYAINIHPLVCKGYNADFDGDQMSVYLQVLPATNIEAKLLMYSIYNIFSPSNGKPLVEPVREITLGLYAATVRHPKAKLHEGVFYSVDMLRSALENKNILLTDIVQFYFNNEIIETTPGSVLFNDLIPVEYRNYKIIITSKFIEKLIYNIEENYGFEVLSKILDEIKIIGLEFISKIGLSMSMEDIIIPKNKPQLVNNINSQIKDIDYIHSNNIISKEQADNMILGLWSNFVSNLTLEISKESKSSTDNDLYLVINSGSRGSILQLRQLGGTRGIVSDAKGDIVAVPIIPSYKEGLNPIEQFLSSYGTRKGIIDKNFKTAISGYLTRKLISLTQSIIITTYDCETNDFTCYEELFSQSKSISLSVFDRLLGRTLFEDVLNIKKNTVLTEKELNIFQENNINLSKVKIRTIFNCKIIFGLCCLCYGKDIPKRNLVQIGRSVGILAAQSLGEPALQMTLRTFHSGGVSSFETSSYVKAEVSGEIVIPSEDCIWFEKNNYITGVTIKNTKIKINNKELNVLKSSFLHFKNNQNIFENDLLVSYDPNFQLFISPSDGYIEYDYFNYKETEDGKLLTDKGLKNINLRLKKDNNNIENINIYSQNEIKILVENEQFVKKNQVIATSFVNTLVAQDIVNDLYRVQSILENDKIINTAVIAKEIGKIEIENINENLSKLIIKDQDNNILQTNTVETNHILCKQNELVNKYQLLTTGEIDYTLLLDFMKILDVKTLMLNNIKSLYMNSNIIIKDVHIELIINQMFNFVKITEQNDSNMLVGEVFHYSKYLEELNRITNLGLKPPMFESVITGITKSGLRSSSFIAAAAFQDTKRIIADAAFNGSVDNLTGLNENLICGNLVPCGTGLNFDSLFFQSVDKLSNVLSLFLKQINIFAFVNLVSEELYKKLKTDINYADKPDWLEQLINETHNKIIEEYNTKN